MKHALLFPVLSMVLLMTACRREPVGPDGCGNSSQDVLKEKADPQPVPQGDPLSQEDLDRAVIGVLETNNDFQWPMVDLRTLWSATLYNDHSVSIGYKPANVGNIDDIIATIDIRKAEWRAVHDALIDLVLEELNNGARVKVTLADILVEDDPVLPIITLRFTDKELITRLYNLENVRYIEPLDYWPAVANDERSTSGCSPSTYALNSADVTTITPNAKLPWNFNLHNIPSAWNTVQGQGITVGVIDAGLSSAQNYVGSDFNNGDSNVGRTFTASATLGASPYTSCSHGTSMAGQAVGPRNNGGASTGVAYKSNLRFIRASEDVVLDQGSERTAVKNALTAMGNDANVRVISMSIGSPFSYGVLSDGVNYATGFGKFVMAAAGTSFSWTSWWGVIYPAAYSNCVAVTGVKENGSKCASCHDGSQVDLTICMERTANSSRNSLSLAPSGATPSYIGGSSSATATAAGIAALAWSAKPTATRAQILNCLTSTAQFAGAPSSSKGYGNINANAAVNAALAL
ncbi:MAG: S8 family serine peptidase [Flavobacteriales bacterium]|nr:S8 family serine peptidase [Flavobacteriales bacterium]